MTSKTMRDGEWHPDEDEWARFTAGSMNAAERERITGHVAGCHSCAELSRVLLPIRGDAAISPIGAMNAGHGVWRQGLAAVAAIGLALTGWSWLARVPSDDRAVLGPATSIWPDRAPEPVMTVVAAASWASLESAPDVRLPASLTLEMRGEQNRNDAFLHAFGLAITPYRDGQYAAAASALEKVTASYPGIPEAWFYLGVSRLHAGDPAMAVDGLQKAATSSEVGDLAQWLEAVALERSGQHDAARRRLDDLCARPGPLRARACDARSGVR